MASWWERLSLEFWRGRRYRRTTPRPHEDPPIYPAGVPGRTAPVLAGTLRLLVCVCCCALAMWTRGALWCAALLWCVWTIRTDGMVCTAFRTACNYTLIKVCAPQVRTGCHARSVRSGSCFYWYSSSFAGFLCCFALHQLTLAFKMNKHLTARFEVKRMC